ncbi:MAG: hypothetical protein Fur0039_22180 [Rhodocyclaceae bacterium]
MVISASPVTTRHVDIFNGDADGLCALQQLRLAEPREAVRITGVKRDIRLLARAPAQDGDRITVLDVSLDTNRDALLHALGTGAHLTWFDHHFAGDIPAHPNLEAHIDTSPEVCTAALVDAHLGGRFRAWAAAAAFGDNLPALGRRLAAACGLDEARTASLARLGELLNYNAYGETVADLHYDPAELALRLRDYADPLDFIRDSEVFARLGAGHDEDMARAARIRPERESAHGIVLLLPDEAWARRVSGPLANDWASAHPGQALAVLSPNSRGNFTVSVRAPVSRPEGADALCRQFPSGGGRKAAAGINDLPPAEYERFCALFEAHFAPR